jgi:peptidoglycan hydrolase CwlO-like protein
MSKKIVLGLALLLVFLGSLLWHPLIRAVSSDDLEKIQQEIKELEDKVAQTREQKQTLSSQIAQMNQQIQLATLRIAQTEASIVVLEEEIASLSDKIGKLDLSLDKISQVLLRRIVATYKGGQIDPVLYWLTADSAEDFIKNQQYLKVAQKHDKMLMLAIEEARQDFDRQKSLKEEKQAALEGLRVQLREQNALLVQQKQEKAYLLEVTSNDEVRYQGMLAAARAELVAIQRAVLLLKQTGKPVQVARGELIGIQGNTGYSTGDHLHFGVYNYSSIKELPGGWYLSNYLNPLDYLAGKEVDWRSNCGSDGIKNVGSGGWQWPMNNFRITQGFGITCHRRMYIGPTNPEGFHPAIDLAGPKNSPIYAVEEGEAYFCKNCDSHGANGVFIFHPDGKMTMYWHVQ